jgi:hypothetical protein
MNVSHYCDNAGVFEELLRGGGRLELMKNPI